MTSSLLGKLSKLSRLFGSAKDVCCLRSIMATAGLTCCAGCTNCLSKVVVELDEKAPTSGGREQAVANSILPPVPAAVPTISSPKHPLFGNSSSSYEDDEDTIVAWEEGDAENPYNWSGRKKKWVLFVVMMLIINSTMGSALPSNALRFITDEWEVESEQQKVLPISVYLIGELITQTTPSSYGLTRSLHITS